jgi:hypothetical protein
MKIFGASTSAVGCFVRFDLKLNQSGGAVLHLPALTGASPVLGGKAGLLPFVISDVQTDRKENLSIQKCFGSRFYTYAFGSDVETVDVRVVAFMTGGKRVNANERNKVNSNPAAASSSGAIEKMRSLYNDGRISNSLKYGKLIYSGSSIVDLMWVGLVGGVQSLDANIYAFTLRFIVIPKAVI